MVEKLERIGRFTSSNIWKLTILGSRPMTESELKAHKEKYPKSQKKNIEDGFGAPALTYIEEKRAERTLGRSIDLGKQSQATIWGKIMEYYCHKFELGLEYTLCSDETLVHPKFKFFSGSPDFTKERTTGDIKCFEPKRFYEFTINLMKLIEGLITLDDFKKEEKEIYWQVVSNCILTNNPKGEFISYTPTEEQLLQIRQELEETNILEKLNIEPWQGRFITEKPLYELPYIPSGIEFPNFVSHEFEVPADDIIFLTKKVLEAEKLLTNG